MSLNFKLINTNNVEANYLIIKDDNGDDIDYESDEFIDPKN